MARTKQSVMEARVKVGDSSRAAPLSAAAKARWAALATNDRKRNILMFETGHYIMFTPNMCRGCQVTYLYVKCTACGGVRCSRCLVAAVPSGEHTACRCLM